MFNIEERISEYMAKGFEENEAKFIVFDTIARISNCTVTDVSKAFEESRKKEFCA